MSFTTPWAAVQTGQSQQLALDARDGDGNALSGFAVQWTSSNPAAVSVDANGVVRGVAAGASDVTATVGGTTTSIEVTVPAVCTQEPFGVNIAGAEWGEFNDQWHTYPTGEDLDYYAAKGLKLIRVPFRWEKIQRSPGAELSQTELAKVTAMLDRAKARGLVVLLDIHNYGRYTGEDKRVRIIGDSDLTVAHARDLWTRLADALKGRSEIWGYGVMNEPHDMRPDTPWNEIAQEIVYGIRTVDMDTRIVMAGDVWQGTEGWPEVNPFLHQLVDPGNNIVFEGHLYFDYWSSGQYEQGSDAEEAYPNRGVDRVKPFLTWLRDTGNQGFIGEYGVHDDDERWLEIIDRMLAYLQANCVNATYWAGGSTWNGQYRLGIHPRNGTERPQMGIVEKYLTSN